MSISNNTFPTSSTTYPLNISLPDFTTSATELSFHFFDTQQQQAQDTPFFRPPKVDLPCFTEDDANCEFLDHFGTCNSADFKAVLSHLQQTSSMDAFITEFMTLSCHVSDWSNLDLLPIFIGGLKPKLQHDIDVMQPRTLVAAQCMARCNERKLAN
ncbi:hypothetical protein ACLB2K_045415 [Fragaria x ananassa]